MARRRGARKADGTGDLVDVEAVAAPLDRDEIRKAARERLKRADAELRRLERKERRSERRIAARDRRTDRRIRRIEVAQRRSPWPVLVTVLALNAVASAIVVYNLFGQDGLLATSILVPDAGQWEFVAYLLIAAGLASFLALDRSPTVDFQQRARAALGYYISVAMVLAAVGLLMALVLAPIEEMGLDLERLASWLAVITAAGGAAALVVYVASSVRGSRLFFRAGYHWVMGALLAVTLCGALVLGVVVAARLGVVFELGLGLSVATSLGVLFAGPGLVWTMVLEGAIERGATQPH
jgi:hypothetical protein